MNPEEYNSFEEKQKYFCHNFVIDNQQCLDKLITDFLPNQDKFLFRGINTASYKLYSSSQVQWILNDAISDKNCYYNFIKDLIDLTRGNDCVQKYIKKHNISDNDCFIMALMQHYGMPSPVLDFSHSILNALYFAWDKADMSISSNGDKLTDYVSLYVICNKIDWVSCSVQKVMEDSANQLNGMIANDSAFNAGLVDTEDVKNEFLRLPYLKTIPISENEGWSFFVIDDNPKKPVKISIPVLNFECNYQIINDRIVSQQGMFIANNTIDMPIVELMNTICNDMYFTCYNIHKNLLDYLKTNYLDKNCLDEEHVYCKNIPEVVELEKEFKKLKDAAIKQIQSLKTLSL